MKYVLSILLLFSIRATAQRKVILTPVTVSGANAAALTSALSVSDYVVINENISIDADVTVAQGKRLSIPRGVIISTTGSHKLLIKGQFEAGRYQVFANTANVKFRPYAVKEIYPEWWGAQVLDNPRTGITNSTTALQKATTCIESAVYGTRAFAADIIVSGYYGINDQLVVNGGYHFRGLSYIFEGSGFKWIGDGDSSKSMIKFVQGEGGGVHNIGFKGTKTSIIAKRLKAAILLTYQSGLFVQRRIVIENVYIGDAVGYWNDVGADHEFIQGIFGGEGENGNNDFHTIRNINIAYADIGIRIGQSQAVEWRIEQYGFSNGGIMFQSDHGGTVIADGWYGASSISGGIINAIGDISEELRFSMMNFSSEHMAATYFINSQMKMKFSMAGEGFIAMSPNYQDTSTGFALIKGSGTLGDGEYSFHNVRFFVDPLTGSGSEKIYIDQNTTNWGRRQITFTNCSGAKDIYFKMPTVVSGSWLYTNLKIEGEKNTTTGAYQLNKQAIITAKNPNISGGWLQISSLFDGTTEQHHQSVVYGQKGKSTQSSLKVATIRGTTIAAFSQEIPNALPAGKIKGVSAYFAESNALTSGLNYYTLGTATDESKFGTITAPNASVFNTVQATELINSSASSLILKGWKANGGITYSLSGSTLTASASIFNSSMVGGLVRFKDGSIAGNELTITGYTSATAVTVSNGASLSTTAAHADIQDLLAAGKHIIICVTYEEFGLSSAELDPNYVNSSTYTTTVTGLSYSQSLPSAQIVYEYKGTGSPEGVVAAPIGSSYRRLDGGTGTTLYIKESGTGNTGWIAK